ncbi:metal-dependent hydrolase [Hyphomicrobium sp.]|uniref:metal-dependent hydrolase n=1 Tax=Hyphomicrobium sp. TaxID=82 RepID=UPI002E32FE50|nr:metal-dependent hydrolase [Hyphomicrobium sp.]HEX2842484.1 metal-dependent hydrolase [Hyphomicrobium sp.]
MANFTTHIAVGTVVAGTLATLTLAADVIATENLIPITMAGVLGSVLPDIDLKDSRPSRAMFSGLAIFFSFAVLFSAADRLSIAELWILWLGTLLLVRYGLHTIFHNLAVHRGIWHSIVAALFCAAATAVVFGHVLDRHSGVAWLAAGFMLIGYLVHLTLDEIYSVDVMDTRIKSSFGTALKLFDRRHPYASGGMAAALALAVWLAPSPTVFVDGLSSRDMWAGLNERLLPKESWFGIVKVPHAVASTPAPGGGIETGAIPDKALAPAPSNPPASP